MKFFTCLFVIFVPLFPYNVITGKPLGVVIWHGMGDSGRGSGIQRLIKMIEREIPGTYVFNVALGSSAFMDRWYSYFKPLNKQLDIVCKQVHSDPQLAEGFHLVGFSQGGLLVRALAQRCPPKKLGSIISIGGPQQGVFGLPFCYDFTVPLCRLMSDTLSWFTYRSLFQFRIVQAQYWHDPLSEDRYREKSRFLADINQENNFNQTYRENLLKAANLVLVRFMNDTTAIPSISSWFGFFREGSYLETYDCKESKQYKMDSLGLKTLDNQGRLHLLSLPGGHLKYTHTWFKMTVIRQFFNITIP